MKKRCSSVLLLIIGIIMLGNSVVYAKPSPPPPLNDECSGAIFITPSTINSYTVYDNTNSTFSSNVALPPCATPMGGDVWLAVIVPASGHLIFDSKAGTMTDGGMAIYSGSCNNLIFIACNDNKSQGIHPDNNMPQIDKCGLNFNDTIFIRFWGKGVSNFGTFLLSVIAAPLQAHCTNMGFENDYGGWFVTLGQQFTGAVGDPSPVYFPIYFNNTNDANFEIVTSGTDTYGGFNKVYSGAKSLKIGETALQQTYDGASVEQTFTVDSNYSRYIYHYAVVLQNPNHLINQQPFFKIELFNPYGNIDSCGLNILALPNSTFLPSIPDPSYAFYKPWTTAGLNLSAYSGQKVTVRFTISDCSNNGHWGYAYLDNECQSYIINSSRDTVCSGDSVTLFAPAGAFSYIWSPGGATTASVAVSPNSTTTYYCLLKESNTGNCPVNISKTIYTSPTAIAVPAAAGNITSNGNSIVSPNQNNVMYKVAPIPNASRYDWYYSGSGVSFFPSNKTTADSVWLNFSATATSGNLTVRGHNNCYDGAFSADYPISVSVGVLENNNDAQFSIYPNPAHDMLYIEFNGNKILQNTTVSIYNSAGQLLIQSTVNKNKTEVDISSFASGVYVVKFQNPKESFVNRFVKE